MKKLLLLIPCLLLMTSCAMTIKTASARTEKAPYSMYNATVADLKVAPERITHTLVPTNEIRRAGEENCKQATINEALKNNGNADLLVEPEFTISRKGSKITSVTVSGRPATYVNFRSLPDSVWTNPVFRMSKTNVLSKSIFLPNTQKTKESFKKESSKERYQGELNVGYRTMTSFMVETIHGIRHKYFFVGIGLGFHYEDGEKDDEKYLLSHIPLFANFKGYLPVNEKFAPYLNLSLGYGFGLDQPGEEDGFYCDLGAGFKCRAFNFGLGWMRQNNVEFTEPWGNNRESHNNPLDAFYIKVGISW